MVIGTLYHALIVAFALGVRASAGGKRTLWIAGGLLLVYGLLGLAWPFASMHQPQALAAGGGVLSSPRKPRAAAPPPDHIVVVIFENEHRSRVMGSGQAPYLDKLAAKGASMTHSYGVTHPSQPNYLALFSGSTHGVSGNGCPQHFRKANNLGHQLRKSGRSFVGYAESLPKTGFRGCASGQYLRKHNPWVNFGTLPASTNRPFTDFPRDYRKLPTVSFVSPNMCHDMHDCSIRTGDRWLKKHFDRYARWATHHNSLLIVTFDENAGGTVKSIPTIIVGANVRPGVYTERLNHYGLLRTIEDMYGLPALGCAATASPLKTIWKSSPIPRGRRDGR
jgi:phosphatidylinositol-3-phosphatase